MKHEVIVLALLGVMGFIGVGAAILDFFICRKYYSHLKINYSVKFREIKSPSFFSFYLRGPYRDSVISHSLGNNLSQDEYMEKLIGYVRNLILLSGGTIIVFGLIIYFL